MDRRYRALRTIATIFKILGWIVLILGILSACGTAGAIAVGGASFDLFGVGGRQAGGGMSVVELVMAVVAFIVTLITIGLYALILIAMSEGIYVVLDIEENTRRMAVRSGRPGGPAAPLPPTQ